MTCTPRAQPQACSSRHHRAPLPWTGPLAWESERSMMWPSQPLHSGHFLHSSSHCGPRSVKKQHHRQASRSQGRQVQSSAERSACWSSAQVLHTVGAAQAHTRSCQHRSLYPSPCPLLAFHHPPLTFFRSSWCQGCATTMSLPPSLAMAHARSWPMPLCACLGMGSVRGAPGVWCWGAWGPGSQVGWGVLQGATGWAGPSALGAGWALPGELERLPSRQRLPSKCSYLDSAAGGASHQSKVLHWALLALTHFS